MSGEPRWADLAPRFTTAALMIFVGVGEIWLGGWLFALGIWLLAGVMMWELSRLLAPTAHGTAMALGVGASVVMAVVWFMPGFAALPLMGALAIVGAGRFEGRQGMFLGSALAILVACYVMELLRNYGGVSWLLWVIGIVIMSDIAGYFAGKMLGGPKFWPAVSPKKTWSGTIAGWIGAALVGLGFAGATDAGGWLIPLSVLVCFAGQMGDIGESAVKRQVGAKDSSGLLPGHGGFLDRFDAMIGAALAVGILWLLGLVPGL
ncbi:phosphatidate cytidylyltransferase [Roseovarius sp. SCSIO 43702]|uniref:phosphatidate cytidylyltransferase n=1 Tax=Roseovarius sp. SCSIO 43702 TaxID=2823043 RepID=UPI001C72A6B7|nr:phosphatidate cytidylyltransferase [Roseovarius sp. SCSIO 43702]QYX58402.1 phosphatidate cytidylyltransferase [Roseovarius sp. SCSIO 43702]